MISKKNFFTISVMMIMVFFLFMVTGGAKIALSNYGTNEYMPNQISVNNTSAKISGTTELSDGSVMYLGDNAKVLARLKEWCGYYKRGVQIVTHGETFEVPSVSISMLVIDGPSLADEDIPFIQAAEKAGITLLFATTPDTSFLTEHTEIAQLMGIRTIQSDSTALIGMHLYEGFLLGGEVIYESSDENPSYYQDMNLRVPWFILESASKVYMSGYLNKAYKDTDMSYTPPIIWRYNTQNTYVYVVNNNFMEELSAIGIYTAVESTRDEVSVYPVINSQNMVLYNYPTVTNENTEKIMELYSRDTINFLETLVWPTITAVSSANKLTPSYMLSTKLDYGSENEPSEKALAYLMELIRENHGEAGLSLSSYSDADETEKLNYDLDFFNTELEDYNFYTCYIGDMSFADAMEVLKSCNEADVSMLVSDYSSQENLISAMNNVITVSPTTSSQYYTFTKDFTLKSVETALGYSLAGQNMDILVYPKTKDAQLQNFTEDYTGCIHTLYEDYDVFDATTLTEASNRIRTYLNLDYEASMSVEGDKIIITSNTQGSEQYFIVRLSNNLVVSSVSDGDFSKIEDGVYLISTSLSETVVNLKEKDNSWVNYFR
ncbi:MAG: DUF2194 domain-containing protein [Lachnospiraceae bacterium]|nr:DUF2194 domain-containing protein [Lachnospiraceae bacterium]